MIDTGYKRSRFRKSHLAFVAAIVSILLGYILAHSMQGPTVETVTILKGVNVWPFPERVVHEEYGINLIPYTTLGPVFSSFSLNCYPVGDSYLGPSCLELIYDGQPGKVELIIPNKLVNRISWPFEHISSIDSTSYKSLPFQLIRKDSYDTALLIDLPEGDHSLVINGGMDISPATTVIIETGLIGGGLWTPIFLISIILVGMVDKLRPKISDAKRH